MTGFLDDLAARRRFGIKPGLDAIRGLCAALHDPQKRFRAIHVAGTNGKGAVCAILDACLGPGGDGDTKLGRYTSPHLARINERFFLGGTPVDDESLSTVSAAVAAALERSGDPAVRDVTFFEALTAVAFELYARAGATRVIMECGLGGRLDATNVCNPELCVITRIGLDHCDWLGSTLAEIAAEKAGIIKPSVPVVLARNDPSVVAVVEARARAVGAPFYYAPDLASNDDVPQSFPLLGLFNRENAVTAVAALRVLERVCGRRLHAVEAGLQGVVWPGRFQRIGPFIVDGAHNPPAATALAESLKPLCRDREKPDLIFGACGDKDVGTVLRTLSPLVGRGFAVRTNNPRSLDSVSLSRKMHDAGIDAKPCASLKEALAISRSRTSSSDDIAAVVCGSLFLAGEALVELGAYPWPSGRIDPSELP
ncbi:MAG: bifunctional folylpolyglutamate synthase/dihydrofolate synthase [Kiritimatiellae bacterium]|nr:bifunctional folylpolyglutamate synthase/dihydrofolate synthase [Kiritimatiellia bacterium]